MGLSSRLNHSIGLAGSEDSAKWRAVSVVAMIAGNIGAFLVLFQLYKLVRRSFIARAEEIGHAHGESIIHFEKKLHVFFEPSIQRAVLDHTWLVRLLNWNYVAFMWTFYGCCVIAMICNAAQYRRWRRVFILSMIVALPWYAIYPLAPPRFMISHGFVDTLRVYGPHYFSESGLVAANQYAAMPSMHVGWTTIGAFMVATTLPWRRVGYAIGIYMVTMICFTVVATANHYFSDIVGGWLVIATAYAVSRALPENLGWSRLPFRSRANDDLRTPGEATNHSPQVPRRRSSHASPSKASGD